jgi:hypothetical protein
VSIDAQKLNALVDSELKRLADMRVTEHLRRLRVEPILIMRRWDYGRKDERYPCWTVLRHERSGTDIAFCEHGFGPKHPWGIVFADADNTSMGMDSAWYSTFLEAVFESAAVTDLPIWRVFKSDTLGSTPRAISGEGEWDATWAKVKALREADPANRYDCSTSIQYKWE